MNTNVALALSFASIFSFVVGCTSMVAEPIEGSTSSAPAGTSSSGGGGGGGGGAGPTTTCEPSAVPDQSACPPINITAYGAEKSVAQKALVGNWYRCASVMDGAIGAHGATGIAFLPDGKFKLLKTDNAQVVCMSELDEDGTWEVGADSGMGLPTEHDLILHWDGGGASSLDYFFANEMNFLRLTTAATGADQLIRIP